MSLNDRIPRVLVVDDDPGVRKLVGTYVQRAGYSPETAENGEEALARLEKESYELVVTDIKLDGMDGLELAEKAQRISDAAIVVMTAYVTDHSYEEAVGKGASDFISKPIKYKELALRLKRVLKEQELTRSREEMVEELRRQAITDGLTGLFNSRCFFERIEEEVNRANRYDRALSLLLLDVDLFKEFNDCFGHLEGDQALKRVGHVIVSCLREVDSAYRYGGEEFTVLLPETYSAEALAVADRIREGVEETSLAPRDGEAGPLTVSVGCTQYRKGEPLKTFLKRADEAMYACKNQGRNRTLVC